MTTTTKKIDIYYKNNDGGNDNDKDIETNHIQPILSQNAFKIIQTEIIQQLHKIKKEYHIEDISFLEKYTKNIHELSLKLGMKKRNRRVLNDNVRCMGRKIDEQQCTRGRLKNCEFCKSHRDNLPHGRFDDITYQSPQKGKRGRKKSDKNYNNGEYIATHLEMINEIQYLVTDDKLVFSYNIDNPTFIGKKNDKGKIEKIDSPQHLLDKVDK